jgi:transposase
MGYAEGTDRNQILCMYSLEEEIAIDNSVRIIDLLVEKVFHDKPELHSRKGDNEVGRPPYSPKAMIKLFLYGYTNRISSSRRLADECKRNIEVKWLINSLEPQYHAIADFRKNNKQLIKNITITFRIMFKDWGLISGNRVAIDGTKIKGNTNSYTLLSPSKLEEKISNLDIDIERYLKLLDENDNGRKESVENVNDDSNIKDSIQQQIEKLQIKQNELKRLLEQSKAENNRKIPQTDSDARSMIKGRSSLIGYNVQFIVDSLHKLILATHVSDSGSDLNQMLPTMKALEEKLDIVPGELIADNGYENVAAIQEQEEKTETKVYVMGKRREQSKNKKYKKDEFSFNEEEDCYICPEGNKLTRGVKSPAYRKKNRLAVLYKGSPETCNKCAQKGNCTLSDNGRHIYRYVDEDWIIEYHQKMRTNYAKSILRKRKGMIEHVFGVLKCWMGKYPLLLRGKNNIETEINIYATAYNIKRIVNLYGFELVKEMIMGVKLPQFINNFFSISNFAYHRTCFA